MRKTVVHMQTTWAMSRKMYEAIVPWWDTVARGEVPDDAPVVTAIDREFAAMLAKHDQGRVFPHPAAGRLIDT